MKVKSPYLLSYRFPKMNHRCAHFSFENELLFGSTQFKNKSEIDLFTYIAMNCVISYEVVKCILYIILSTEGINSSVARFARKFLWKFLRLVGHTKAAVQPSKKKIARGTCTKTF